MLVYQRVLVLLMPWGWPWSSHVITMDRLGVDKAIRAWQLQGQAANTDLQSGKL